MQFSRKISGYLFALLLAAAIGTLLFFSFKKYGLWTLLYIPQVAIVLMCLYIFFPVILFFSGYFRIKKMFRSELSAADKEKNYFTVLVPAHNEERLLPGLLESINKQTYPKDFYQVVVVADNCQDKTATIAGKFGAFCLQRSTDYTSSKQDALKHAMDQFNFSDVSNEGFVCIIDADCEVHPDYLRELNRQLLEKEGTVAIQSYRFVKNIYESNITVLDGAAEALRNWIYCAPRKLVGASVFINGSGVVFKKTLFEKLVSLPGDHLAEDKEWKAYLSAQNTKIEYCAAAQLSYEAVSSAKKFQRQRQRWIGSHMKMMKKYGWKTLSQSILNRNLMQFDFFCSLMQIPRTLLLAFTVLFSAIDLLHSPASFIPHWGWIILVCGILLYGVLGMFLAKARTKDFLAMPAVFGLISGVVKTSIQSLFGKSSTDWTPTRPQNE